MIIGRLLHGLGLGVFFLRRGVFAQGRNATIRTLVLERRGNVASHSIHVILLLYVIAITLTNN